MTHPEIWLIRHGETAWSRSGQHTGWTDLDLLPDGEEQARRLGNLLAGRPFARVYSSPLRRAVRTCELAGYAQSAILDEDLREWNYGSLEGKTAATLREAVPGWTVWDDGPPDGEAIEHVYDRAARFLSGIGEVDGDCAVFAHGHFLRILACAYLGLPPRHARYLALSTASVSVLGWEREQRVLRRWNFSADA